MSSFYGLEIARKSLYANQRAMDLIGHNIANANTEGYTRQRLDLEAIAPASTNGLSTVASGQAGGGVDIVKIEQIRDEFLDTQYRREKTNLAKWDVMKTEFEYIEDSFSEPSDYGMTKAVSDLFNSFEELSKNAESEQIRALVRQNAIKLSETFKTISTKLTDLQQEENNKVYNLVEEINDSAKKISELNDQIFRFELSGENANDLRDRRNLIVDKLSSMVGVKAYEAEEGTYRVDINGIALVNHMTVSKLEARSTKYNTYTDENFYEVYWENGNNKVSNLNGEIRARLDIRDGENKDRPGSAFFLKRLDTLAKTLVEQFNTINTNGYTLPYGNEVSKTGVDFFDPTKTTARNINISDALSQDVANIAASDALIVGDLNWGNNQNILDVTNLRENKGITTDNELVGNIEGYVNQIVTEMAIASSYNARMAESQEVLTDHLNNERLSVTEVSIDEEMANMIKYQHSYSAAAKLMSVMDELLESLIGIGR